MVLPSRTFSTSRWSTARREPSVDQRSSRSVPPGFARCGTPEGALRPCPRPPRVASDRGYAFFEHTADVGIRAWGPTLDVAFAQAG